MKQILMASNDEERASIKDDTDDDEAEWHKTGSICDTGCGGNWLRGRVYGPILTLNGHNFYDTQNVKEKWFLGPVILLKSWYFRNSIF